MSYKIAIVGEAYNEQEAFWKKPFIGPSGEELDRILADAGIARSSCFLTAVFKLQPERNDLASLCGGARDSGSVKSLPALGTGKYLLSQYLPEVDRLHRELIEVRPNLVVALGSAATWALLGSTRISKIRGAVASSPILPGIKILPTYHPATILKQYDLRHVTVLDFLKAKLEAEYPEIRRPRREIWLDPSIAECWEFKQRFIDPAPYLSFDIETAGGEITCVGFAPSIDRALVVPFVDYRRTGGDAPGSYWSSLTAECEAWNFVSAVLSGPQKKLGQNVLYDTQFLWQAYGVPVHNLSDDTMLLHHALHPESLKALDFLGSVYTNEAAWKMERPRGKHTIKREDS